MLYNTENTEDKTYKQVGWDIDQFLSVSDGYSFTVNQLDSQYKFQTRDAKRYRWQILEDKVKHGELEKTATGKYRKVLTTLEEIDWQNTDLANVVKVKYPLKLEQWIKTYSKSVVVLAGDPGAGKTAFLENMLLRNMNNPMGVEMFSNDMTDVEIAERLIASGVDIPNPAPFKIWECADSFADAIRLRKSQDKLNLIDYLDLNSDTYRIGDEIDKIYYAINKGVAVVAIQKKFGQSIGMGGVYSIKRAKLYLSMSTINEGGQFIHRLEVIKNRGRQDPFINPRGMEFKFKLVAGIKMIEVEKKAWNDQT